MHKHFFHYIAMAVILFGGLILLYFSFVWYLKDNMIMSAGMLVMGMVALANFYLHLTNMKKL